MSNNTSTTTQKAITISFERNSFEIEFKKTFDELEEAMDILFFFHLISFSAPG